MSLLEMFCDVDSFCVSMPKQVESHQIGRGKRGPQAGLCLSEIMTIMIYFHQSHYRDFKAYYCDYVCQQLRSEFPGLVSDTRFVDLMPSAVGPMLLYLLSRMGQPRGVAFIDSTPLPVCHNKRICHHKGFAGQAARGKSSIGYSFGCKLHLVVNDQGELLSFRLTPGNVDDRKPVPSVVKRLWGKLFGDKGYASQPLFEQLFAQGIHFFTPPKKSKKKAETRLLPLFDRLLARKRSLIETLNDQLKHVSQIVHTRHRSPTNFLLNLLAGLLAYTFQEKKPALHFEPAEQALLPALI